MKLINTLRLWQEKRFLWILMAAVTLILTLIAHYFFQDYLYMEPCEQCVYIRFAMLVMALGGIIAAVYPNDITRIIGYTLGFYGIIIGINFCLTLDAIHAAVHSSNPFGGVDGCREIPIYPFALPLHEIAPSWFLPTGECGFDNPIVPEDAYATLSSIQKFFVGTPEGDFENGFYSNGWYLIPSLHFMNMAMACLLCFVCCLVALFAMFVGFFTRAGKNAKIQSGIVVVLVIILLYVGEAMKAAKIAQMAS